MPITSSAKKALRVSERKNEFNVRARSRMKTAIKSFLTEPTADKLHEAYSRIDRAVKQHLMHRNTAARRKSVLSRKLASQSK